MNKRVENVVCLLLLCMLTVSVMTVLSSCGEKDEDIEIEQTESDKKRQYKCGETAHYEDFYVTIDHPVDIIRFVDEPYEPDYDYFVVPIHVECKSSGWFGSDIGSDYFEDSDLSEDMLAFDDTLNQKDLLPSRMTMKKGDVFDGYILIHTLSSNVQYEHDGETATWKYSKKKNKKLWEKTKKKWKKEKNAERKKTEKAKGITCKSISDIEELDYGDIVKATVYYCGVHDEEYPGVVADDSAKYYGYDYNIQVSFEKDGSEWFYVVLYKDEFKKAKQLKQHSRITIKGELEIKGYENMNLGHVDLPLLTHGMIVQ